MASNDPNLNNDDNERSISARSGTLDDAMTRFIRTTDITSMSVKHGNERIMIKRTPKVWNSLKQNLSINTYSSDEEDEDTRSSGRVSRRANREALVSVYNNQQSVMNRIAALESQMRRLADTVDQMQTSISQISKNTTAVWNIVRNREQIQFDEWKKIEAKK